MHSLHALHTKSHILKGMWLLAIGLQKYDLFL